MGLAAALLPLTPETPPNACRFTGARGHVESWFLRANDPASPRALWLKLTISAPYERPIVAEAWFIFFDGVAGTSTAHRSTHPIADAHLEDTASGLKGTVPTCAFEFGPVGAASGQVRAGEVPVQFTIGWSDEPGPCARPFSFLRHRVMREGPLPRFKLATPHPALRLTGEVTVGRERFDVTGWLGSQGHNWGPEHAIEYAWGQCYFPAGAQGPDTFVEGGAGRLKIGGRVTPNLASMVVRRGGEELHFDRVRDLFRHESVSTRERWALRIKGEGGEARLRLDASDRPMVCLAYPNPDDRISYCFNSKLANALLEVWPRRGAPFTCQSAHGAALEFLRPAADPRYPVV